MKLFWVDLRPWNRDLATAALESGADALVLDRAEDARKLGRITTVSPDGDIRLGTDALEFTITGKESENAASQAGKNAYAIVSTSDWTIIPLENLVAQSDKIIAVVRDACEAEVAATVLEKGSSGVLLKTRDPAVVKQVAAIFRNRGGTVNLVPFTVTGIRSLGMGDRVCVDTCSMLSDGDGMLMGNTSSAMLMVHAETLENPYVAPRPFRVNAGAVHAYILLPGGKTAYLADLAIGGEVIVSDAKGTAHPAIVGRVKIERRPLILVEAAVGSSKVSLILQNAETIRLVRPDGTAISVVRLQEGDIILGCVLEGGRHFGMAVKETIIEK
jgi:3-dehydroquinate synthase II